jgi:hypothetical protein
MSFVPDPIMQSQNSNARIAAVQEDCRDGTEKVLESAAIEKKSMDQHEKNSYDNSCTKIMA